MTSILALMTVYLFGGLLALGIGIIAYLHHHSSPKRP
jgi:hypothetical protein